jgi:putative zinc finger/helix-turn-helix YgiT family protein
MVVPHIAHLHCGKCGEDLLDLDAVDQLLDGARAAYRVRHGLLPGADIRALRDQLGLTQDELAALLHLGPNMVARWEVGRKVQSAATDLLLRLLRDLPGTLAYLRCRATS